MTINVAMSRSPTPEYRDEDRKVTFADPPSRNFTIAVVRSEEVDHARTFGDQPLQLEVTIHCCVIVAEEYILVDVLH